MRHSIEEDTINHITTQRGTDPRLAFAEVDHRKGKIRLQQPTTPESPDPLPIRHSETVLSLPSTFWLIHFQLGRV